MAEYQQRDNSGALFKNAKKTEAKHPDYQGDCMVNGIKMRISAWLKESNGTKFMSLAFSEPYIKDDETKKPAPTSASKSTSFDDFEDDIPF